MTVSELRKKLEIVESIRQGNLKISVEDEFGFSWETKEIVIFDDRVVIEREE